MNQMLSIWKGSVPVVARQLSAPAILQEVAYQHGVTVAQLKSAQRYRIVAHARFDAMSRIRALTNKDGTTKFSLCQIGRMFGGRDHTTVLWGLRRWPGIAAEREAVAAKREAEAA